MRSRLEPREEVVLDREDDTRGRGHGVDAEVRTRRVRGPAPGHDSEAHEPLWTRIGRSDVGSPTIAPSTGGSCVDERPRALHLDLLVRDAREHDGRPDRPCGDRGDRGDHRGHRPLRIARTAADDPIAVTADGEAGPRLRDGVEMRLEEEDGEPGRARQRRDDVRPLLRPGTGGQLHQAADALQHLGNEFGHPPLARAAHRRVDRIDREQLLEQVERVDRSSRLVRCHRPTSHRRRAARTRARRSRGGTWGRSHHRPMSSCAPPVDEDRDTRAKPNVATAADIPCGPMQRNTICARGSASRTCRAGTCRAGGSKPSSRERREVARPSAPCGRWPPRSSSGW